MRVIFFWKFSKFNAASKDAEKTPEKMFCFWDKSIWIICIYLSLLLREYLSLAVIVLRKGLKNFHECKSNFYNSITFTMITQDDKGALIKIESVFRTVHHVACREVLSNGSFSAFIQARLSWLVISEIHKLWGSSFFENIRNLMQIRKTQKKIQKKWLLFEINASELFAFPCLVS